MIPFRIEMSGSHDPIAVAVPGDGDEAALAIGNRSPKVIDRVMFGEPMDPITGPHYPVAYLAAPGDGDEFATAVGDAVPVIVCWSRLQRPGHAAARGHDPVAVAGQCDSDEQARAVGHGAPTDIRRAGPRSPVDAIG